MGMASESSASEPRRIALIIDDEPTIRSALRRYFTRKGWDVEEAADGAGGLHMLTDGARFDVVLCDLRMPGFSGIELHDELAASNPSLLRRFVFSTGDMASSEAANFVERTTCPVLQKPFELRALDDIIIDMNGGTGS
jgi:DNA-binding NtrC family response regulator